MGIKTGPKRTAKSTDKPHRRQRDKVKYFPEVEYALHCSWHPFYFKGR